MNTNITPEQIEKIVKAAMAPIVAKLEELEQRMASILKPKVIEVPENVAKMKVAIDGIPQETLKALGVLGANCDPKMPWCQLLCVTGKAISIKQTETGFRVRVRDGQTGELITELTPSFNGLNAALAKLAE